MYKYVFIILAVSIFFLFKQFEQSNSFNKNEINRLILLTENLKKFYTPTDSIYVASDRNAREMLFKSQLVVAPNITIEYAKGKVPSNSFILFVDDKTITDSIINSDPIFSKASLYHTSDSLFSVTLYKTE